MSHFTVLALFREQPITDEMVATALEPFNENVEVAPYMRPCYCVGLNARRRANELADQVEGSFDDLRNLFYEFRNPEWSDEKVQTEWEKFIDKRRKAEEDFFNADPENKSPDPVCEYCHGSGEEETTYNPNSKWDWYQVGGRWDMADKNYGPVSSLLDSSAGFGGSFAILTPDGEWVEQGSMGWWGMVSNEKKTNDWKAEQESIFEKFKDCFYILLDCHI